MNLEDMMKETKRKIKQTKKTLEITDPFSNLNENVHNKDLQKFAKERMQATKKINDNRRKAIELLLDTLEPKERRTILKKYCNECGFLEKVCMCQKTIMLGSPITRGQS